jgi:uncharacterized protein YqeY
MNIITQYLNKLQEAERIEKVLKKSLSSLSEAEKQESPLLTNKQTIEIMTQMDNIRKSWKLKYPME